MEKYEKEIDNHLAPFKDKLSKKQFKGVTAVYKNELKNNATRIRLREKLKQRRVDEVLEASKSW